MSSIAKNHIGTYTYPLMQRVHHGRPAEEALAEEAQATGAERVFIIAGKTLSETTDVVRAMEAALKDKHAGTFCGIPPHTPRAETLAAAAEARAAKADLLVSVGGGSVTDATKMVQLALKHDITRPEELDAYHMIVKADGSIVFPPFAGPDIRQLAVPTTLSGGENYPLAGCTNVEKKLKQGYMHPGLIPYAVILDPAITVHTPQWLWLSTGIRAVDHAVEALCSPQSNPHCDGAALQALRLLGEGLPRCKADSQDLEARLWCQIGVWNAMMPIQAGIPMGASHAIGHILGGTCDVPHGHTSCVMMPAVLRYNADYTQAQQAAISAALGAAERPAAEVLDRFIADLDQPRSLAAVGVKREQYEQIAEFAMHDFWLRTNARPIAGPEQVLDILELAS